MYFLRACVRLHLMRRGPWRRQRGQLAVTASKVLRRRAQTTVSAATFADVRCIVAPPCRQSAEELTDLLLTFLEVAIHSILFARRVYPEAVFERRKQYGVAVWMSRHPKLNDCIHEALYHMKAPIMKGAVEAVVMLLVDAATGQPREQYVFGTSITGTVLPVEALSGATASHGPAFASSSLSAGAGVASGSSAGSAAPREVRVLEVPATYSDLETMFASALLRIGMLEVQLPPLPPPPGADSDAGGRSTHSEGAGTTFTLLLRTHESLSGPNDRADYAGADEEGSAVGWTAGLLGSVSRPSGGPLTAAAAPSAGYWMRVDPSDAEAALTAAPKALSSSSASAAASALPAVVSRPLKSVRAGALALDISVEYPAAAYGYDG